MTCFYKLVKYYTKRQVELAYEKWLARLEVNGVRVLNKLFMTKEEAIAARLKAEKEYI